MLHIAKSCHWFSPQLWDCTIFDLHTGLKDRNDGIVDVILCVQDNHVRNPPAKASAFERWEWIGTSYALLEDSTFFFFMFFHYFPSTTWKTIIQPSQAWYFWSLALATLPKHKKCRSGTAARRPSRTCGHSPFKLHWTKNNIRIILLYNLHEILRVSDSPTFCQKWHQNL